MNVSTSKENKGSRDKSNDVLRVRLNEKSEDVLRVKRAKKRKLVDITNERDDTETQSASIEILGPLPANNTKDNSNVNTGSSAPPTKKSRVLMKPCDVNHVIPQVLTVCFVGYTL